MKQGVLAFASGLVFSIGLCLSGMTQPSRVLGFLDFAGAWDPSLAFVMIGAVGVAGVAFRFGGRRRVTSLDGCASTPASESGIDGKLVVGAALFGVGWGLSGLCPGPALVSLASGQAGALVFVASMVIGMAAHRVVGRVSLFGAGARGTDRGKAQSLHAP